MIEIVNTDYSKYSGQTKRVQNQNTNNVVEKNEESEPYSVEIDSKRSHKLTADQVETIRQHTEAANASLRNLVEKVLAKQGSKYAAVQSRKDTDDEMTISGAQQAISEDGYWGVNALSDRIVAFAKAVSGDDPSKIAELKEAIDKGFELAGKSFGAELPDICNQTYNAVMQKLDAWSSESKAPNIDVTT